MRMIRMVTLVIALVVPGVTAQAQFMAYGTLYRMCFAQLDQADESLHWDGCFGYVAAIADAFANGARVQGYRACLPYDITMKPLVARVHGWMRKHPGDLLPNASTEVAHAMADLFPCDDKGGGK